MASLVAMCPQRLKDHLQLRAQRFKVYLDMREEVFSFLDHATSSNPTGMDIASLQKGGGCWTCGGPHYSGDCPKDGKGKGKFKGKDGWKGKGKGKNKDGSGGKGKGKGKFCTHCQKSGHTRETCWKLSEGGKGSNNGPKALKSLDPRYREIQSEFAKAAIGAKEPVLAWLINYASVLVSRYNRGADGRTPYERSTGKTWKQCLPEFGETILYQPLKGERLASKLDARFEDGVYLGIQEGSAMKFIGTAKGVVRTWTIKRRPESERFEAEIFDSMVGVPWEMMPSRVAGMKDLSMRQGISMDLPSDPLADEAAEESKTKAYVPRGLYIRRDVELAANCDGCAAAKHGLAHRQHSRGCRERIATELGKTEEGKRRLDRVREREEHFMMREFMKMRKHKGREF